ncbi:hypothetical protein ACH4Q7_14785 [Streptomyces roseolus]|uniref:hypothetical protein n=1 Tax=Streptomyces roseolus TaxID=67358 RepID=UPI0037B8643B
MRTKTITSLAGTAALLLALTLTACSSTPPASPPPATTTAAATTPAATAADRQACVEAIADVIDQRPADFDPETDSDPEPPECAGIPEAESLDVYMEGLKLRNERARNAL